MKHGNGWIALGLASAVLCAGSAAAVSDADKCEATKLKRAGQYSFCRFNAAARALRTGDPVDYSKCDTGFSQKWAQAETQGGGMCPTGGDASAIQDQVTADAASIALRLTGTRFVDNGDGTVTDTQTGLMWEKKTEDGSIHHKDNTYGLSLGSTHVPNGTIFTEFLAELNDCESVDGTAVTGGFAGYCDWRLPTSAELQTILLEPYPCSTNPCIDQVSFGPTVGAAYRSSSWYPGDVGLAWCVGFEDGALLLGGALDTVYARAVRGGY